MKTQNKPSLRRTATKGQLGCFSPEAMLITLIIEFVGALWVGFRYRLNKTSWLIIALLVFLGIFQLAEFLVCESAVTGLSWARIGYMSITMLPPLGVSLAMAIANKKSWPAQVVMYLCAAAFIVYWGYSGRGITADQCEGNYVFFQANNSAMWLYGTYYYVFLAIGVALSIWWAVKSDNHRTRWALIWLTIGYAVFILPTTTVAILDPATRSSIPSVMCGFAVFLAITLIFAVAPLSSVKRFGQVANSDSGHDDSDKDDDSDAALTAPHGKHAAPTEETSENE